MAYTYILECNDGSYYVGSTKDLQRRLKQHQTGKGARYTRSHSPVKLVYFEEYETPSEAYRREKELQRWKRAQKKALIAQKQFRPEPPVSQP
ncbi:MAG: GIY-YIG nuclease family protein [Spirochaetaceae bacterium]|jgi:predicted GIY-YIG superfamily endonuclease|nr:GIY-YIG nuclease family protein [Spirochaetaceae bacterium]